MKHFLSLLLSIQFLTVTGQDSVAVKNYYSSLDTLQFTRDFTSNIILEHSFTELVDNYIDDAHVHLETTSGFDSPNPYLIACTGASYKWTTYQYNGININNPLIAGDASFHIPMYGNALAVDAISNNFNIYTTRDFNELEVGFTLPDLGGRVGFTDWFINNISGHPSAKQRETFNIKARPFNRNSILRYRQHFKHTQFSLYSTTGSRNHVDQAFDGTERAYSEQYQNYGGILSFNGKIPTTILVEYRDRANDGAEFQYQKEETAESSQLNATIASKTNVGMIGLKFNMLNTIKNEANFSKNIIDQDGEGLHPYYIDGKKIALGISFTRKTQLKSNLSYSVALDNTFIHENPNNETFTTNSYIENHDIARTDLYRIDWTSRAFSGGLLNNKFALTFSNAHFRVNGGLNLLGLLVMDKNIITLAPSVDLAYETSKQQKWQWGIRTGFQPNPFTIDQIEYLSKDYLNGVARYSSKDKKIAFTTGGKYRQPNEHLQHSYTIYADIPLTYKASDSWSWTLVPQYRQFRNTWTTAYKNSLETVGSYQTLGEKTLWFPNDGIQEYTINSLPNERMSEGSSAWTFNQPFYAGATFRFEHQTSRWFFSGSFTANMIVGVSGMGAGPLQNNINALSETTADPNLWKNSLGRLDSDRSFISRIVASYRYQKDCALTLQMKYKDGQSFANYTYHILDTPDGKKVAFTQREVKGDNPFKGIMGRREDFFQNVELKGKHTLHRSNGNLVFRWAFQNLLDFANETSEFTFGNANGYDRAPLELQVPRSFTFSIAWQWK